jgi:hypothetical protein
MKLIFCQKCQDVVKLQAEESRTCLCGESWGRYKNDGLNAVYGGEAVPLGFDNPTLAEALQNQPKEGRGRRFEAFVIAEECDTFKES